jgi:hypothetical protein
VGGVKMLDDDKAEPGVFGNVPEKLFQGLQAAGGSTQANDGKGKACPPVPGFRLGPGGGFTNSSATLLLSTAMWSCFFHGWEAIGKLPSIDRQLTPLVGFLEPSP